MRRSSIGVPNVAAWREAPLEDLCDLISRGTAPTYVEQSSVLAIGQRCVRSEGFDSQATRPTDHRARNVLKVRRGDVLLNSTGIGTIGRSCVFDCDGKFVADSHVTVLRADNSKVHPAWIDALLRSSWGQRYLEAKCFTGSTNQVELSRKELLLTAIPVPPIQEQRRIVEILDAVDERMDTVSRELQKLRLLELSMRSALIRTVDADGIEVGTLGDIVTGSTPPADEVLWGGDLFFVTPAELGFSPYVGRSPRALTEVARPYVRRLPKGAVLAVCIGFSYGKLGIADVELCTNQQINAIIPKVGVNSTYVYLALAEFIARLKGLSAIQVTPIINKSLFSSIKIPLPAESDQRRIASCVETVWRRISDGSAEIEKLQILKQGLVEDLLTGRVRV